MPIAIAIDAISAAHLDNVSLTTDIPKHGATTGAGAGEGVDTSTTAEFGADLASGFSSTHSSSATLPTAAAAATISTTAAADANTPTAAATAPSFVTFLTVSSPPMNDIETLVAQKQHQLAYFQRQQLLQQTQQRQLVFRQQQLRRRQQEQQKQQQLRQQEKQRWQQNSPFADSLGLTHPTYEPSRFGHGRAHGQENEQENVQGWRCEQVYKAQRTANEHTVNESPSMILPSIGARTTSNAAPNSTVVITLDAAEPGSRVDLVDDVWRLIFYILAGDCKDLGRSMLVNRRFYSLIAYDVVLWRLTYNLTVSGSVFASQKPSLLSPTWIKHEQDPFGHSPTLNEHAVKEMRNPQQLEDQSGSALGSRSPSSQTLDMNDGGWSGSTMLMNSVEPRRCRHTSTAAQSDRRGSVTLMAPGLQLPSPLVLPHHRRIVQSIGTTSTSASHLNTNDVDSSTEVLTKPGHSVNSSTFPTTGSPFSSPDSSSSPAIFSPSSSVSHNGAAQTPASTPSTPSFQLRLPPLVSQVISSSTTPLSAIQHHIPTTTLMHHHPAVYWKYQVVEWLEQEKLRCLRLGLFWGLNAAASRTHGRNKAL